MRNAVGRKSAYELAFTLGGGILPCQQAIDFIDQRNHLCRQTRSLKSVVLEGAAPGNLCGQLPDRLQLRADHQRQDDRQYRHQ